MKAIHRISRLVLIFFFSINLIISGQVMLPRLVSDGMVLQRDVKVKIWGWAKENEKITVQFLKSIYKTTADIKGEWSVQLPKLKAGGPYVMEIITKGNKTIIKDIMIGEVWVCSGQSNMELNMRRVSPLYESDIANSENPDIRYFEVPDKYNFISPQKDLKSGKWEKPNPTSVLNFSAVSYFFGKMIYEKYHVPVGLINSALGGSPVEAWISENALKEFPQYYDEAQKFKDSSYIKEITDNDNGKINAWNSLLRQKDEGYKDPQNIWYNSSLDTTGWSSMSVLGFWSKTKLGSVNGVVWFRKKIDIPQSLAGKPARLILGTIVDADSTFINGIFVGTTSYQYPPRRYTIPGGLLKAGENTLVVRIINSAGKGGFTNNKKYAIEYEDTSISLQGEWKYKLGARMEPLPGRTVIQQEPSGLYNAMIAPLLNYSIKGVIWYQGESNTDRAAEYNKLFSTLIEDWRKNWEDGEFPFLFVQLPNYSQPGNVPSVSKWALLREAQLKTLSVPNTAMVVAIDIGEAEDIHPLDKKDVAERLFLAAENVAYGDDKIEYSGPIYKSMDIEGNKIILSFAHTGSGLIVKGGGELRRFAIAAADKKFIWAKAKIEDTKVIVWNDNISQPVAVRYAWADNPEGANLYNKEGLPASPFRTDNF
jgi:sialate O-acetylesterase